MPVRVGGADGRCRQGIGIESQLKQCRGIPPGGQTAFAQPAFSRPALPEPPAPATQPDHGGARHGSSIIARTRDYRNRHQSRDPAPVAPTVKLRQIIRAHQPDKPYFREPALQPGERVDGIARAHFGLDRADPNRRAARNAAGSGHARGQPGHPLDRFQHVAGRNQPPHFIKPQRGERIKADPAMRRMRRIKAATE